MPGKTQAERNKEYAAIWSESCFDYVDVIVSSGKIRREFFRRCKELKIDPYRIALKAGIPINTFTKQYVNTDEPHCTKTFSQDKFLKMIELVGIDIKVTVLLKPLDKVSVELKEKNIIKE